MSNLQKAVFFQCFHLYLIQVFSLKNVIFD
uniref:Uncharacterized protein n=1 Tax=Anguilla anguilla TaxID=7936 RepID=A0A0E9UCA4_ANGAN